MILPPFVTRYGVPLAGVLIGYWAWRHYGWPGVAFVASAMVLWFLMHFNRLMHILRKASRSPVGHVGSAVMLNAKLRPGVSLMHVIAMTQSLGVQRSPPNEQPEHYRWTDGSDSYVDCEFNAGRLVRWQMVRPQEAAEPAGDS